MKIKNFLVIFVVIGLLLFSGCTAKPIAEVKTADNVGKTVTVKGTVAGSVKIGSLSGYIVEDAAGDKIGVSSSELPEDGKEVTVSGTLMKDTIFGYYINEK